VLRHEEHVAIVVDKSLPVHVGIEGVLVHGDTLSERGVAIPAYGFQTLHEGGGGVEGRFEGPPSVGGRDKANVWVCRKKRCLDLIARDAGTAHRLAQAVYGGRGRVNPPHAAPRLALESCVGPLAALCITTCANILLWRCP